MKTIAIIGTVDKRVLVYPMARALSIENSVMIATDDGAYRRLYTGTDDTGTVGKVDIVVASKFDEHITNQLDGFGIKYDYRLVVSNHIVPKECDYIVYCRGVDRTFCPEEVMQIVDKINHKEVIITYDVPDDRSIICIEVQDAITHYLFNVEETKQLRRIMDKNINKVISKIFSEALDISEAQMLALLNHKDTWEIKK